VGYAGSHVAAAKVNKVSGGDEKEGGAEEEEEEEEEEGAMGPEDRERAFVDALCGFGEALIDDHAAAARAVDDAAAAGLQRALIEPY
jgi:hypothetical protein